MGKRSKIAKAETKTYKWTMSAGQGSNGQDLLVSLAVKPSEPQLYGSCIGIRSGEAQAIIKALKEGLPISSFEALQKRFDVSVAELAAAVNIPSRTLARRRREGRFRTDESERLFRIAKLFDRASDVLGSGTRAREWLKSPKKALGGKTPLTYADTEPGAQEVSDLLGRLEHGVFS